MSTTDLNATRSKVVASAQGKVLEIGFGSGYNLPFYKGVEKLYALEPSSELFKYAEDRIKSIVFPVEYLQCSAESIQLKDNSIDTVVSTWTLCSIAHPDKALKEIHRILKHGGKFLFAEHGQSPKKSRAVVQKLLTPMTKHFTGNCHWDRKIDELIENSGLFIENIETTHEDGRPLMFSYKGVAIKPPHSEKTLRTGGSMKIYKP